jgi:hypothetical protein
MWAAGESLAASADLKGFVDSVLLQTNCKELRLSDI